MISFPLGEKTSWHVRHVGHADFLLTCDSTPKREERSRPMNNLKLPTYRREILIHISSETSDKRKYQIDLGLALRGEI